MGTRWVTVCGVEDFIPGTGVCALHDGEQVAIFHEGDCNRVYAVSNFDPVCEANVLSRGIIGSMGSTVTVTSPLNHYHYCLLTGLCLEQKEHHLKTYSVRVARGKVQLKATVS